MGYREKQVKSCLEGELFSTQSGPTIITQLIAVSSHGGPAMNQTHQVAGNRTSLSLQSCAGPRHFRFCKVNSTVQQSCCIRKPFAFHRLTEFSDALCNNEKCRFKWEYPPFGTRCSLMTYQESAKRLSRKLTFYF